ncbi:uncharacterized protein DS421_19g658950 [Arachis hypogaea]|uniref:Uncharacterized protein n=1 Tax=Arachis hypogaea TaxID=3818 RepID=A0A6B9V8T3_ARAHY|nr:uncharacterized protein DS421_19g658950 [Arachis hypogaea]
MTEKTRCPLSESRFSSSSSSPPPSSPPPRHPLHVFNSKNDEGRKAFSSDCTHGSSVNKAPSVLVPPIGFGKDSRPQESSDWSIQQEFSHQA